ncbi:transporter [Erysipelothrix anatis]|uniref:transporter n=1 Tax=Erysipelothrix anatis TaxID=2683713 RepID=UPI0013574197|nr:transporter [Erysipelothrix anatis]
MNKIIKSFLKSLLLVALAILLFWIGYVGFIGGPARAYEREDRLMVEAMMESKGFTEATIIDRFSYDEVYYITEINDDSGNFIFWFNKDLTKTGQHDVVTTEPVHTLATNFGMRPEEVSFGVYQDKLVYVLKNKHFEKFVDIESHNVVYDRGSGV